MIYHDVVVVGAGGAGLRAAIAVNQKNVNVAVLTKVHPVRSHSGAAQGGINAAMGNNPRGGFDSVEKHAFDTIKGSDYLADQPAALKFTRAAPGVILELEHWGCPFSRMGDGRVAQRPFGGAGFPRTCYAADKTGHVILHTLYEQAVRFEHASERDNFKVYDEWMVTRLVIEEGKCRGVIAYHLATGKVEAIMAEAVIFATGGAGRVYLPTTNAVISTGLGLAIPYWAGVPVKDMEFVQFHPTTIYPTGILMTEGCRGEGGFLTNKDGERFLKNYSDSAKAMETAPRDIVARNMQREINEGRGIDGMYINLDIRHLGAEKIMERLPGIRDIAMNFVGVDPITQPIPVRPGQHYTMGGVDTDENGATCVEGFYAAGECACVSVHGANRLGGNSLLETLVFGKFAGEAAADYVLSKSALKKGEAALKQGLDAELEKFKKLTDSTGGEKAGTIRDELGRLMAEKVGIFRKEDELKEAWKQVKGLQKRFENVRVGYSGMKFNQALVMALEVEGNLAMAETIVYGATVRKESRGSHFRTDFPKRDDENFLRHSLVTWDAAEKKMKPTWKDVVLGLHEPKERKY
ncbi:MAG: FAD-binding protein [Deltaproteobacteria bacterium]|nr:FAD-binding protein [Deltaproteobacteria bacterium]